MPGLDIGIVVRGFSAGGVEALARLPDIRRRAVELPVYHPVQEPPIEPAAAEHRCPA